MTETLIKGRVLFIGAHCDDIEIGCGGTAARHAKSGNPIAFAVATPPKSYVRDTPDSPQFMVQDVKDLKRFASRVTARMCGFSQWLWKSFEQTLRDRLKQVSKQGLDDLATRQLVVDSLNKLVAGSLVFEGSRFEGIKLHPETQRLLKLHASKDLPRLNRMLIEDACKAVLRYHERRRLEASNAAAELGLTEEKRTLFFGSFEDGELDQNFRELRAWFKDIADEFSPDTVFIHRDDDHTDHQAINKVGLGAFQNKNLFLYYIPRPAPETPFDPNYAEDVSGFIDVKTRMCACHGTQADDYIGSDSVTTNSHYWYLRWYARIAPNVKGYAEPFILRGWRARYYGEPSSTSPTEVPSVRYDLRLVKEADGTLRWEEG